MAYQHFHHLPPSRIIKSLHMTHNGYSLAYFYRNICLLCRYITFGNVSRVVVLLETRKSDLLTLQHSETSRDVFSPASI